MVGMKEKQSEPPEQIFIEFGKFLPKVLADGNMELAVETWVS